MDAVYSEKTVWKLQEEFSWFKDECYMDYAAGGLHSSLQLKKSTEDLCSNLYANPHSLSAASRCTSDAIDQIRFRILELFHTSCKEYTVIFTSGATQAIKLLLENFSWENGDDGEGEEEFFDAVSSRGTYAYTATNHTSVVGGRIIANDRGAQALCIPDDAVETLFGSQHVEKASNYVSNSNSLFAYPAECNFSGRKYPLDWIRKVQGGALNSMRGIQEPSRWFCLLDAATYCSTNELDLSVFLPDFVCLSFYKLFGYPTGLGALLVRNVSAGCLRKRYFGGGTVDISVPSGRFHKLRASLHESFEDGTLPFLSIISLGHALDTLPRLGITFKQISLHTFMLAKHLVKELTELRHWNNKSLVEIYSNSSYNDVTTQGGIVAFNLRRADGSYIGFVEVLHIANLNKIHLRTGCFCNVGACQRFLRLTDEDLLTHFQAGHVCGDERDLVSGRPTGAIRISFGYPSTLRDVTKLLAVLKESFLENSSLTRNGAIALKTENPVLKGICLYPVKSCGAMKVSSWRLTNRGLDFDRQWMVVTSSGVCLTQKQEPNLCKILPVVDPQKGLLTLSFSGENPIVVTTQAKENGIFSLCTNKVCGDAIQGEDCGDDVANWLSLCLQKKGLRLIRQSTQDSRTSKINEYRGKPEEQVSQLSLANQAQYLLVNENSIESLKKRIGDEPNFNSDTLVDRFRANLIVSGAKDFEELEWFQITIGQEKFKMEGACTRCQMICIDQQTGEKNRKPLVEISRAMEGKIRFGVYCSHLPSHVNSTINIGDLIFVQRIES